LNCEGDGFIVDTIQISIEAVRSSIQRYERFGISKKAIENAYEAFLEPDCYFQPQPLPRAQLGRIHGSKAGSTLLNVKGNEKRS
jgi:hypothetical protein